jgi:hypothetical protein
MAEGAREAVLGRGLGSARARHQHRRRQPGRAWSAMSPHLNPFIDGTTFAPLRREGPGWVDHGAPCFLGIRHPCLLLLARLRA